MTTVALRPVSPDDSSRLFAWRNSPEVRAYMYTDHEIAPEEHARWFPAAMADPARRYWIIEVDDVGVGLANLIDIERDHASWAYYIADPSQRGRGVGAMAEFRVIETAFGLGLSRLNCEVLETNTAVIKLHKRFGFVEHSRLVARAVKNGAPVDAVGLTLTAEGWTAHRAPMIERLRGLGFEL